MLFKTIDGPDHTESRRPCGSASPNPTRVLCGGKSADPRSVKLRRGADTIGKESGAALQHGRVGADQPSFATMGRWGVEKKTRISEKWRSRTRRKNPRSASDWRTTRPALNSDGSTVQALAANRGTGRPQPICDGVQSAKRRHSRTRCD